MSAQGAQTPGYVRANWPQLAIGLVLLAGAGYGARWIAGNRREPAPRKVMQFVAVNLQQPPRPPPPPPPPKEAPPPKEEEPQTTRVEVKASDIPPPEAAPRSDPGPAAGPLALAGEAEGPGDSFNLAGNPGGRSLSAGGWGDGSGDGVGQGYDPLARFGWYYSRMAADLEQALQRSNLLSAASTRVELRIWADSTGRISRLQLVRSTGDPRLDAAIRSMVGVKLREPPPPEIPMPMIARLTARRPG